VLPAEYFEVEMTERKIKKVVVAYSGGLDTSVMVTWLKETYGCEVVCMTADLGQGEELDGLEEKAIRTGATKLVIADLRAEFVKEAVFTAIKSNAVYEGFYLLGTALARPVISKALVEVAINENADAIAHGATGKGNDQVRFELSSYALKPDIQVVAPWREWKFRSRTDLIEYAAERGIPITSSAEKPYSMDRNLMHISYEGGILEDPWFEPPEDMFLWTRRPEDAPSTAELVEVEYEEGVPVAINGTRMGPVELLETANEIAAKHGIGRIDIVENRYVGIKSRGVYETPGVTILHMGHRAVESLTLDREVMRLRDSLVPKITEIIYNGYWFSPEMNYLRNFMDDVQQGVTGTARLRLYKGAAHIVGRKAPNSLYSREYATFEEEDVYRQADADGFIRLNALRLRLHTLRQEGKLGKADEAILAELADFIE